MEVGLIIQGNPLWDFLESPNDSCILHAPRDSVLPGAARQSQLIDRNRRHALSAATVGEGKMKSAFFLPQVSPTSILQNSTHKSKVEIAL
jgi:hypothetical protein